MQSLPSTVIFCHTNCYKKYTNKINLSSVNQDPSKACDPVSDTYSPSLESSWEPPGPQYHLDRSLCLFSQKKKKKKKQVKDCKDLIDVSTYDACPAIKNAAESRCDNAMIVNIRGVDLIAAEAKHRSAFPANYVSKTNLKFHHFEEEDKEEEDVYAQAFQQLVEEMYPNIAAQLEGLWHGVFVFTIPDNPGKEWCLKFLQGCRSEKQKRRLQHHFN